jgi:hypothetical protein
LPTFKADPSSTTVSLAITKPDFVDAHAWLAVDTTTVSAETLTLVFGPEGMPERDRSDYDPEHQLDALTTPSEDGAAARCDRKCIVGGRGAADGARQWCCWCAKSLHVTGGGSSGQVNV